MSVEETVLAEILDEIRADPFLLSTRYRALAIFYETEFAELMRRADQDEDEEECMPPVEACKPASSVLTFSDDEDVEEDVPPSLEDDAVSLTASARAVMDDRVSIALYTRAITAEASCRRYIERGERHLKLDENEKAQSDADNALKMNRDSARAYRLRSLALWNMNKASRAYMDMCEAQRIDYDDSYDSLQQQIKDAIEKEEIEPMVDSLPTMPEGLPNLPAGMNLNEFMQNPQIMSMAQSMLNNPEFMRSMMQNMSGRQV